ncbi:hypothetical protein [Brevibacterium linens]|uniref:hypothetical protein n=1 Tax=Brevibacterium linens TaxID=1703 RepID=UPI001F49304F|nr:hypothetical protein [Brevibacterium linens]
MGRFGRRGFFAASIGVAGIALSGCFRQAQTDPAAVADALRSAVTAMPEHLDGEVQFQDSFSAGTTIGGVLTLAGSSSYEVADSLHAVLETIIRTYVDQPGTDTAFVRVEGHPSGDAATRVLAADIIPAASGANVTTDDLAEFYGI